jgi:hypothetical protein
MTEKYCVAVLAVVAFAQLYSGDLGHRIRLVGLFQRAGQQVVFPDRLRTVARIDAARTEEAQTPDSGEPRAMDQVGFDDQVLVEEVGAEAVVGLDAPTFAAATNTKSGFSCLRKFSVAVWFSKSSSARERVRTLP